MLLLSRWVRGGSCSGTSFAPTLGAGSLDAVGGEGAGREHSIPFVCVYRAVTWGDES